MRIPLKAWDSDVENSEVMSNKVLAGLIGHSVDRYTKLHYLELTVV